MKHTKKIRIKPYSLFQKPMLAINYYTNFCNSSMLIQFNEIIDENVFYRFIKILVENFKDLKCYYSPDGIIPIKITDHEFIKNKIKIIRDNDDNRLLYSQQNHKLDIENGNTFFATLNNRQNGSSIILSINHVVADGQTMLLLSYLAILTIQSKKFKSLIFLLLLKMHNSKLIKKKIPYILPYDYFDDKKSSDYGFQKDQSVLSVSFDIDLKFSLKNLGTNISTAAVIAMKTLYPNENKIELRRPIGLRNRIKGLKSLLLGEYHVPSSLICDVHNKNFEELKTYISKSSVLDQQIKDSCDSLLKLSNNIKEAYEQLFTHTQQYCAVNVSSFGNVSKKFFEDVHVTGSMVQLTGDKPFFNIQCGTVDNILKICISYNPYKIKHTQSALFLVNILSLLNIEADESHIYEIFANSDYV